MIKGSEEWFLHIAEKLGDLLLGIEIHDSRFDDIDVSPPYQIKFIIPAQFKNNTVPEAVMKLPDCSGLFSIERGNQRFCDSLIFDFQRTDNCVSVDFLKILAPSLNLTVPISDYWKKFYFGVYSPRLFED